MAAEFALVAVDRSRLDAAAEEGRRSAIIAKGLLSQLSFHLSGAQLGITITSLMLGIVAEPAVAKVIEPAIEPLFGDGATTGVSVALALVLATVVQMVLGELIPKGAAISKPLPAATLLARPIAWYGVMAGPVIRFLNAAANWMVRKMGIEPVEELAGVRTLEEIDLLIRSSEQEGMVDHSAAEIVSRTVRFTGKTAQDALVPRVDVVGVSGGESLSGLVELATATGFSRFPVIGDSLDTVHGVVHVKDVTKVEPERRASTTVDTLIADVLAVPESRDLASLLLELGDKGGQLAIVVDEYGGTEGIITLEDILEEIVGDIEDEHDPISDVIRPRRSGPLLVDASLHPDEVDDACGLAIPEGDYETLAGFVLSVLGRIPAEGEAFDHDGWLLRVTRMDKLRIAEVEVTPPGSSGPVDWSSAP